MLVELPTSPEGLVVLRNTATGESVEVEPARGGAVRQVALRDSTSPHPALHSLLQYGPEVRFAGSQLVLSSLPPLSCSLHSAYDPLALICGCDKIPWPNRIRDGKYKLEDGRSFEGLPINEPFPRHTSLHGLLYDRPMTIAASGTSDDCAHVTLVHHLDGSDAGYPFKVKVELTYRLTSVSGKPSRMECETVAYNEGTEAAPFATGWHPYFRLPAKSIDLLHMTMEAGETYIIDEQMIPVGTESWPGMADELLVGKTFDSGFLFADLPKESDGIHRTLLSDRDAKVTMVLWQDSTFPCLQIYTPDTRDSIAVEPMSHPTNGFNTNNYSLLQPGASTPGFKGSYGIYLQ